MIDANTLPIIFLVLAGFSVLMYAILDGYDLGVGILLPVVAKDRQCKDTMIASIGPFWDANETWLVLAVGLLLVAFPAAHNDILANLYLPATFMLVGLILRGVAFDFRAKAMSRHRHLWDHGFFVGSLLASLTQGYMLGRYVMAFEASWSAQVFAVISGVCVTAAYAFIGGGWLIMKTSGDLQRRVAHWARVSARAAALGILLVCVVNTIISDEIYQRWLGFPQIFALMPIPLVCTALFIINDRYLRNVPHHKDFGCWIPFLCAAVIFFLCFQGLAYSYYPYVVPGKLTVWEAASATESLRFMFYGAVIVVPIIVMYTAFSYRVFWGKADELRYY